jgi:hypothetical protein
MPNIRRFSLRKEAFPIYIEVFLRRGKLPIYCNALIINILIHIAFILSDLAAGIPLTRHLNFAFTSHFISLYAAMISLILLRDKTIEKLQESSGAFLNFETDVVPRLKKVFDQTKCLIFGAIISAGGVVHHIILSIVIWGKIWWYSLIDIFFIGFLWWFVVGTMFWTCTNIAFFLFKLGKEVSLDIALLSFDRRCGLGSLGELTLILSVMWGITVTFGTITTFTPVPTWLLQVYLILDFIIISGSMTALFLLQVLSFHQKLLNFKKEKLKEIEGIFRKINEENWIKFRRGKVDVKDILDNLFIFRLFDEVETIKEWPLELNSWVKFILSQLIPGITLLLRLINEYLVL